MTVGDRIAAALLRVRDASGAVVGAGLLVGPTSAVTCAQVTRTDAVTVDFPLLDGVPLPASAVERHDSAPDGTGDVVVPSLRPPAAALPVPLCSGDDVWGHRVRVCGFPTGLDDGRRLSGELRARQGTGWVPGSSTPPSCTRDRGAPARWSWRPTPAGGCATSPPGASRSCCPPTSPTRPAASRSTGPGRSSPW